MFVECTLYNANVNLFQSITFLVEFTAAGACAWVPLGYGVHLICRVTRIRDTGMSSLRWCSFVSSGFFRQTHSIRNRTRFRQDGVRGKLSFRENVECLTHRLVVFQIVFGFFILFYTYQFFKEARRARMRAFVKMFWTWIDVCFLLLSYVAVGYAIYRVVAIDRLLRRFGRTPRMFTNFYPTVLVNVAMQYVLAFLVFLATVKVCTVPMLASCIRRSMTYAVSYRRLNFSASIGRRLC